MSEVACTCFNHALQFRTKKELISELEKKNGFSVVAVDCSKQSFGTFETKGSTWYLRHAGDISIPIEEDDPIDLYFENEHLKIDISIYPHVMNVFEFSVDGKDITPFFHCPQLCNKFKEGDVCLKQEINVFLQISKKYLTPLFGSNKFFLVSESCDNSFLFSLTADLCFDVNSFLAKDFNMKKDEEIFLWNENCYNNPNENCLYYAFDFPFAMSSDEYDFISAVDNILAMQREAKAKGCAGITLEEINKEISDYRKGL